MSSTRLWWAIGLLNGLLAVSNLWSGWHGRPLSWLLLVINLLGVWICVTGYQRAVQRRRMQDQLFDEELRRLVSPQDEA